MNKIIEIYQKPFIVILNQIYKVTGKINENVRNKIITLSFGAIMLYFLAFHSVCFRPILKKELTQNHIICGILLCIIIGFSIKDKLKTVEWRPFFFSTYFLAGAGILVISFLHPIGSGYRAFAVLMILIFPQLYIVWNNREDYKTLYDSVSKATCVVGLVYYLLCWILAFNHKLVFVGSRMNGTMYDANLFSMVGMVMATCALYILLSHNDDAKCFLLAASSEGFGISIVLLGQSRLSILVLAGNWLAFFIFTLKNKSFDRNRKKIAKKTAIILFFVILGIVAKEGMICINNDTKAINTETQVIQIAEETNVDTKNDLSAKKTEKNQTVLNRFYVGKGMDLDTYTAGRYHIWKNYCKYLNMTGNDFSKADWKDLTENTVKHAHNNFLEYGFRLGIPVAILHTIVECIAGIFGIIFLFGRKYKDPIYLFVIVSLVMYAIQSMFDIATIPFERMAPFFFYMSLVPVIEKRKLKS